MHACMCIESTNRGGGSLWGLKTPFLSIMKIITSLYDHGRGASSPPLHYGHIDLTTDAIIIQVILSNNLLQIMNRNQVYIIIYIN